MSGNACANCHRGKVDGLTLRWDDRGRLVHHDGDAVADCTSGGVYVPPGMIICSDDFGEHVASEGFLAEYRTYLDGRAAGTSLNGVKLRSDRTPARFIRYAVGEATMSGGEIVIADTYSDEDEYPPGTEGIIIEGRTDDTPLLLCGRHVGVDGKRIPYRPKASRGSRRSAPGPRRDAAKPKATRTTPAPKPPVSVAPSEPKPRGEDPRVATVKAMLANGPVKVKAVVDAVGGSEPTARALLVKAGAVKGNGKRDPWTLP